MPMQLVHLWSARAKHAVIMRLPSSTLPRRAAHFPAGTTRGSCSWPPLWPRGALLALVKTRNQLMDIITRPSSLRPSGAPEPAGFIRS